MPAIRKHPLPCSLCSASCAIRNSIPVPLLWYPKHLCLGHLDEYQHLAAFRDKGIISGPHYLKRAPKPDPPEPIKPAFDDELVSEHCRAAVVDFGANNDRILLVLGHLREAEPELFGKKRPRNFDETQVGDVMNNGCAIRIEEHNLHIGSDARSVFVQHAKRSFRKRFSKQCNCLRYAKGLRGIGLF